MPREVKAGFEEEFQSLMAKKKALESEKESAIKKAIEELENGFSERAKTIDDLLQLISFEIPEEEAKKIEEEMAKAKPEENTSTEEESEESPEKVSGGM